MGNMKSHTVKFSDEQWQIIVEVAKSKNVTAGQFVRDSIEYRLWVEAVEWPDTPSWGGSRIHTNDGVSNRKED